MARDHGRDYSQLTRFAATNEINSTNEHVLNFDKLNKDSYQKAAVQILILNLKQEEDALKSLYASYQAKEREQAAADRESYIATKRGSFDNSSVDNRDLVDDDSEVDDEAAKILLDRVFEFYNKAIDELNAENVGYDDAYKIENDRIRDYLISDYKAQNSDLGDEDAHLSDEQISERVNKDIEEAKRDVKAAMNAIILPFEFSSSGGVHPTGIDKSAAKLRVREAFASLVQTPAKNVANIQLQQRHTSERRAENIQMIHAEVLAGSMRPQPSSGCSYAFDKLIDIELNQCSRALKTMQVLYEGLSQSISSVQMKPGSGVARVKELLECQTAHSYQLSGDNTSFYHIGAMFDMVNQLRSQIVDHQLSLRFK